MFVRRLHASRNMMAATCIHMATIVPDMDSSRALKEGMFAEALIKETAKGR